MSSLTSLPKRKLLFHLHWQLSIFLLSFIILIAPCFLTPPAAFAQSTGGVLDIQINSSSDDAEEKHSTGEVKLSSSDLELISDGGNDQTVGVRFRNLNILRGATIANAYVQFTVDETNSGATALNIQAQAADNAPTFSTSTNDISSRRRTKAAVSWNPPAWDSVGEAGADQRTPNLTSVVQEIVNRPGWASGNSLAIIITGSGERTAEAYDGTSSAAPLLHIEFLTPPSHYAIIYDPPPPSGDTFACLESADEVEVIEGFFDDRIFPDPGLNKAFDARTASFLIWQSKWGIIHVEGDSSETGMCWAGGYVESDKPWDASWDDHKDTDGPTRNSAAISNHSYEMTVTGMDLFNVHDGFRTTDAYGGLVQHSRTKYVRDDGIENDHLHSVRITDVLFNGSYTGLSAKPSGTDHDSDGFGEVFEVERVLLWMMPMPYQYKYLDKPGNLGSDGFPWDEEELPPYGHGSLFKIIDDDLERNIHWSLKDSVFLFSHYTTPDKADFPDESLVDVCEDITLIWLGGDYGVPEYPGYLPTDKFPDCFTIVTGDEGRQLWVDKVTGWYDSHPEFERPNNPGSLEWPLMF